MSTLADQEAEARSARSRRAAGDRWRVVEERIEGEILAYVRKHPGCVGEDLRAAVRGAGVAIDRVRRRLVDEGKLRRLEGYTLGGKR